MWDGVAGDVKSAGLAKLKGIVCSVSDQTAHALGESLVSLTNPEAATGITACSSLGSSSAANGTTLECIKLMLTACNITRLLQYMYVDQNVMPTALRVLGGKAEDKDGCWALGKRLLVHVALVLGRLCRLSKSKRLQVGGLVDNGWGLQPEREQGPLRTLVGLRQHAAAIGEKQEGPRCRSCLAS